MVQLLDSSTTPVPQFASLSILPISNGGGAAVLEPVLVASPLAMLPNDVILAALQELTIYTTNAAASSFTFGLDDKNDSHADTTTTTTMQIFRPFAASGAALYYRVLHNGNKLARHLLRGSENTTFTSLLLCVGFVGSHPCASLSALQYAMPQRMNECVHLLQTLLLEPTTSNTNSTVIAQTILSAFLITDNELQKTNEMAAAPNVLIYQDEEVAKSTPHKLKLKHVKQHAKPNASDALLDDTNASSEKATINTGVAFQLLRAVSSANAARTRMEQVRVLSIAESDSVLQKYTTSANERKALARSKFHRKKKTAKDPDFDAFEYRGPVRVAVNKKPSATTATAGIVVEDTTNNNNFNESAAARSTAAVAGVASKQDSKSVLPLAGSRADKSSKRTAGYSSRRSSADSANDDATHASDDYSSGGKSSSHHGSGNNGRKKGSVSFDDDVSHVSDARSNAGAGGLLGRVQVNIALNEDLSCSYKLSQLSSCSVEGVVQVQVKASTRSSGPFLLVLRDPQGHIESLQENKKYADNLGKGHEADYKFAITVAKGDAYIPVMRFKCIGDLRPVPIRVQTRVKVDEGFCRVALQISSNPNNEAPITDLTIIMGVPDDVKGESLLTQPAGGIWNDAKRSVIWCVSELGDGEKFQLQARFELKDNLPYDPEVDKPKFPVLVRCQCLFAQLSGVEIDVRDIPDIFPADVAMKLARRFRLSHRERS